MKRWNKRSEADMTAPRFDVFPHGDGANWIHSGLRILPNAVFVLGTLSQNQISPAERPEPCRLSGILCQP